jgi:NADPH:quinone reductase-like Zn-dependent oxidoreductase
VFAIQLAKAAGCFVVSTSSSDQKLAKAKALGADGLINYKTTPEWDVEVRKLTGGRGVDHVIEIGGAGTMERSYRSLANNGCMAMIGFLATAENYPVIALPRWGKLVRVNVGSREGFEAMNRAITANGIKPVIDKVFAFESAIDAYEYEATGQHFGKVVITI